MEKGTGVCCTPSQQPHNKDTSRLNCRCWAAPLLLQLRKPSHGPTAGQGSRVLVRGHAQRCVPLPPAAHSSLCPSAAPKGCSTLPVQEPYQKTWHENWVAVTRNSNKHKGNDSSIYSQSYAVSNSKTQKKESGRRRWVSQWTRGADGAAAPYQEIGIAKLHKPTVSYVIINPKISTTAPLQHLSLLCEVDWKLSVSKPSQQWNIH